MATGGFDKIEIQADEIETDAVPVTPTLPLPSPEIQSAKFIKDSSTDDYRDYLEYMPTKLKDDNFEILILYSEHDRRRVKRFQHRVQKECVVTLDGVRRYPTVKLQEEFIQDDPVYFLDRAAEKALYVFLFVTKYFCEEYSNVYKGNAFLINALETKSWSVIPVQTEDRETRRQKGYKLPMMLNALQAISYWDRNFYIEAVQRLLEAKASAFLQMNLELLEKRKGYFYKNIKELKQMKHANLANSHSKTNFVKSVSMQEHDSRPLSTKPVGKGHCESKAVMEHSSSAPHSVNSIVMQERDSGPQSNKPVGKGQYETEAVIEHSSSGYVDLEGNPNDCKPQNKCAPNQELQTSTSEKISLDSNPAKPNTSPHAALSDGRPIPDHGILNSNSPNMELNSLAHPASLSSNPNSGVSTVVNPPSSISHQESDQYLSMVNSNWDQRTSSTRSTAESAQQTDPEFTSGHGDASNSSAKTESGPQVVHHHHHHCHKHKHFKVKSVKYMAVGEKAKLSVVDSTGDFEDSAEESDDGEDSGEEPETEENPDESSGFCSQETDVKTAPSNSKSVSSKPTTQGPQTEEEEEETPVKTVVEPALPPSYEKAMGLSEMTDPFRSDLLEASDKLKVKDMYNGVV